MIKVYSLMLGHLQTNTYILQDESTSALAVVDPAVCTDALIDAINKLGSKLEYILLTHGHYDHIGGVNELLNHFDAKVVLSKRELSLLNEPSLNGTQWHDLDFDDINVDVALDDKDKFMLGDSEIEFISTPGHTFGSGCYLVDNFLVSGDTLFCLSIGRTDLPTGDDSMMLNSLKKLSLLNDNYTVLPGHGQSTMLDFEKKHNPYLG